MRPWAKGIAAALIAALAFIAVKAVPSAGGFFASKLFVEKILSPSPPTVADVEAAMQRQGITLFAVIKQELPVEYDGLVHQWIDIMSAKGEEQAFQEGYALLAAFRRRHAEDLRKAPAARVYAVLAAGLDVLKEVQQRESPEKCGDFAIRGAIALHPGGKHYQALFDTASAEMVRAVGAANRQPSPTPPATDDDYQELFDHYRVLLKNGTLQAIAPRAIRDTVPR